VQRLSRRERFLVGLWLVLGIALWNGVYDMTLGVGIKEYLFRSALHEAGRAPRVGVATVLDRYVFDAVWVSTFWASLVVLAGLLTIRLSRRGDSR
jgi:hypothetical protein